MAPFWAGISHPRLQNESHWLRDNSVRSHGSPGGRESYFLPLEKVYEYFNHRKLVAILEVLFPNREDLNRLAHNIATLRYTCVFLTLLCMGQQGLIEYFLGEDTFADKYLPFTRKDDLPTILDFDRFREVQQAFSAPKLRETNTTMRYTQERILPIQEKTAIKDNESASVFRIKIHPDFDNLDPDGATQAAEPHVYILKVYHNKDNDSVTSYKREMEAYAKLQQFRRIDSLARCYCTFSYRDESYIILEYATHGTLESFMKNMKPPDPSSEYAHAVCTGLLSLGQAMERLCKAKLWHQDISPYNIVVNKRRYAGLWEYQFKLIDFGKAHSNNTNNVARDTYGTKAYGAPETHRADKFAQTSQLYVTQKIDVFSLACVWLEMVIWMTEGWPGVQRFRDNRLTEISQLNTMEPLPFFHDGSKILKSVQQSIEKVTFLGKQDGCLTRPVCDFLITDMLKNNVESRLSGEELWPTARQILQAQSQHVPDNIQNGVGRMNLDTPPQHRALQDENRGAAPITSSPPTLGEPLEEDNFEDPGPSMFNSTSLRTWTLPTEQSAELFLAGSSKASTARRQMWGVGRSNTVDAASSKHHRPHAATLTQRRAYPEPKSTSMPTATASAQPPQQSAPPPRYCRIPHLDIAEVEAWASEASNPIRSRLPDEVYCKQKLKNRDHVFIMDNTWNTNPYWRSMCELLRLLSSVVENCDPDGSDLYFTTNGSSMRGADPHALHELAKRTRAEGNSNLEEPLLTELMSNYEAKLRRAFGDGGSRTLRPISVYILTDGMWEDGNPEVVFLSVQQTLKDLNLTREQVGFQFISFGHSPEGMNNMALLDEMAENMGAHLDIIDTEPSNGNVWKMLLGAIDDRFDNS